MKSFVTSLALAAGFTALAAGVQADEMPMNGVCQKAGQVMTFDYISNFNDTPAVGDAPGRPELAFTRETFNELVAPMSGDAVTTRPPCRGTSAPGRPRRRA